MKLLRSTSAEKNRKNRSRPGKRGWHNQLGHPATISKNIAKWRKINLQHLYPWKSSGSTVDRERYIQIGKFLVNCVKEIRCDLPVKAKTSTSIFMLTIIPTITPSSNQVAPGFHHGKINLSGSLSSCQQNTSSTDLLNFSCLFVLSLLRPLLNLYPKYLQLG